ncbi:MAG: M12 family metallopeptidase, partial [Phycisphaerae bacterium]
TPKLSKVLPSLLLSLAAIAIARAETKYEPRDPAPAELEAGIVTKLPDELMMIDGDIAVPRDADPTAATYGISYWPNGVVPYEFAGGVTTTNRNLMRAAMDEWESLTAVRFVARNGETDYIRIMNATFNASEGVGMLGGQHRIWITSWNTHGTLVHELGHALAFWHEQSRSDRNIYVDIEYQNVSQNGCQDSNGNAISCDSQFDIRTFGGEHGPYDFGSVMHYSACAFSNCGFCSSSDPNCRTITVLGSNAATWQNAIGQRVGASFWDARIMSFLYPYSNWRFADDTFGGIQLGTFLNPWQGLALGYLATPNGGKLWLKPGDYTFTGVLNRPMRMESTTGTARIGD